MHAVQPWIWPKLQHTQDLMSFSLYISVLPSLHCTRSMYRTCKDPWNKIDQEWQPSPGTRTLDMHQGGCSWECRPISWIRYNNINTPQFLILLLESTWVIITQAVNSIWQSLSHENHKVISRFAWDPSWVKCLYWEHRNLSCNYKPTNQMCFTRNSSFSTHCLYHSRCLLHKTTMILILGLLE